MRKITFIGASGVGKSTLYKSLVKARTDKDLWSTPDEERLKLAKLIKSDFPKPNYKTLMVFLLKMGVFKNSRKNIVSELLWKKEKEAFLKGFGPYEGLLEIMLRYYDEAAPGNASKKIRMLSLYLDILIKDVILLEQNGCKKMVVYDDGIFHNNYGLVMPNSLKEAMSKYPEMATVVNPAAIVHCNISLEENMARRQHRIEKGRGTFMEVGLDQQALLDLSRDSLKAAAEKVQQFREVGIPILELNMSDDLKVNVEKMLHFIRQIQG